MRIAANLSTLYADLPLDQRFARAASDGFRAVEILAPYEHPPQWYADRLKGSGLRLVLINTPMGSDPWPTGAAAQVGAGDTFRRDVLRALDVCAATGCRGIHVMTGPRTPEASTATQAAVLLENLSWAASQDRSVILHLEPLNPLDRPGYYHHTPQEALGILRTLAEPNVGLQFDFYHVAKQGLALVDELRAARPWVRHVQVAGSPDRDEPRLSRDGFLEAFQCLYETGYAGHVGLEYRPRFPVNSGLVWMQPLLDRNWIQQEVR